MTAPKRSLPEDSKGVSTKRRQSNKVSSAPRLLEEDSDYVPPLKLRSPKPKTKKCAAPRRPTKSNLRDPFQALTDDIVGLVVAQLSARDTETLRRVSKFWKENSQYHCGRAALVRHFPWAAAEFDEYLDIKEANLCFRRCLYHQESIARGLATKAIRCEAAFDWDIRGKSLTWASKVGDIEVRGLNQHMKRLGSFEGHVELEAFGRLAPENLMPHAQWAGLRYVSLTEAGDIILQSYLLKSSNGEDDKPLPTEILAQVTSQGKIMWQKTLDSTNTCKVAVGARALYYIESRMCEYQHVQDDSSDYGSGTYIETEVSFIKRDLDNGKAIYQHMIPSILRSDRRIRRWVRRRDINLYLTSGEAWAVWSNDDRKICVFSTESGHLVYHNDRNGLSAILMSSISEKFWNVNYRYQTARPSSSYAYNNETKTFDQSMVEYKQARRTLTSGIGFDNDRRLLFRLLHSCFPTGQNPRTDWLSDTLDPLTRIGLSRLIAAPRWGGAQEGETHVEATDLCSVSLPDNSTDRNKRRHMEVELPWTIRDGDFFGMVKGYLVYHAMRDELLVVVDFWPDW